MFVIIQIGNSCSVIYSRVLCISSKYEMIIADLCSWLCMIAIFQQICVSVPCMPPVESSDQHGRCSQLAGCMVYETKQFYSVQYSIYMRTVSWQIVQLFTSVHSVSSVRRSIRCLWNIVCMSLVFYEQFTGMTGARFNKLMLKLFSSVMIRLICWLSELTWHNVYVCCDVCQNFVVRLNAFFCVLDNIYLWWNDRHYRNVYLLVMQHCVCCECRDAVKSRNSMHRIDRKAAGLRKDYVMFERNFHLYLRCVCN